MILSDDRLAEIETLFDERGNISMTNAEVVLREIPELLRGYRLWAAVEADARRYQWIRAEDSPVTAVCMNELINDDGYRFMEGEELDAAIDTEIAKEKENG